MPPKPENIVAFLEKRGYKADVQEVVAGTFKVSLHSQSIDDVAALFANIQDGSRFVVSIYHDDFIELIESGIGIDQKISVLRSAIEQQITEAINNNNNLIDNVNNNAEQSQSDIKEFISEAIKQSQSDINNRITKEIQSIDTELSSQKNESKQLSEAYGWFIDTVTDLQRQFNDQIEETLQSIDVKFTQQSNEYTSGLDELNNTLEKRATEIVGFINQSIQKIASEEIANNLCINTELSNIRDRLEIIEKKRTLWDKVLRRNK